MGSIQISLELWAEYLLRWVMVRVRVRVKVKGVGVGVCGGGSVCLVFFHPDTASVAQRVQRDPPPHSHPPPTAPATISRPSALLCDG